MRGDSDREVPRMVPFAKYTVSVPDVTAPSKLPRDVVAPLSSFEPLTKPANT
jgi:hypothetical protein